MRANRLRTHFHLSQKEVKNQHITTHIHLIYVISITFKLQFPNYEPFGIKPVEFMKSSFSLARISSIPGPAEQIIGIPYLVYSTNYFKLELKNYIKTFDSTILVNYNWQLKNQDFKFLEQTLST